MGYLKLAAHEIEGIILIPKRLFLCQ